LPNDLKILKYFLWDQLFLKFHINKMIGIPEYKAAAQSIEEFIHSQAGLIKTDLASCTFTIFDLETSGFFPEIGDEILSIGAIKMKDLCIQYDDAFYTVMKPINKIPKNIQELTGLSSDTLDKAQSFPVGLKRFLEYSKGSILVAHPATFDIEFIKKVIKQWKLPCFSPAYIDSHVLANDLFSGKRNYLDHLIDRLNITERERHHALNDAIMTADIFVQLLRSYAETSFTMVEELLEIETHS
jgi:DNA polymerase III epsilon subunit family exonuclease